MPALDTPASPATLAQAPAATPSPEPAAPAAAPAATTGAAAPAPVEDEPQPGSRAYALSQLHHVVNGIEGFGEELFDHAKDALKAGEHDVHACLERLSTVFDEFRNGLLSVGATLPAKLAPEAAGLAAKAKG